MSFCWLLLSPPQSRPRVDTKLCDRAPSTDLWSPKLPSAIRSMPYWDQCTSLVVAQLKEPSPEVPLARTSYSMCSMSFIGDNASSLIHMAGPPGRGFPSPDRRAGQVIRGNDGGGMSFD